MKGILLFRSTHERAVSELEKDIKFLEVKNEELKEELKQEVSEKNASRALLTGSLKMANARNKELDEEIVEMNRQLTRVRDQYKARGDELLEAQERIKELEKDLLARDWCIQERDRELEDVRKVNRQLLDKAILSNELYRQFKWKCDKSMEIQFVTRAINQTDVKKFLKLEDVLDLYTLVGMAGKK